MSAGLVNPIADSERQSGMQAVYSGSPAPLRKGRLRKGRLRAFAKRSAFLLLSGVIVVISSEKYYWYPQGFSGVAFLELVGFYSVAVSATLLVIHRYRVSGFGAVALASAVFALIVEGVITPVLYEDGPLPVMALYFFGWHGLFSFVFGWYAVRRLAFRGRWLALGLCAALQGAGWGLWSTTYWRPDSIAEMREENATGEGIWDPGQWPVSKFAVYASIATALFVSAHWLLGHVWPEDWAITRRWRRFLWFLLAAGLGLMTIVVPWAPLKLAALGYPILWLLRRHRDRSSGESAFAELKGTIPLRNLAPAAMSGPAAVAAYWMMTVIDPSVSVLDNVFWVFVFTTLGAGVALVILAARQPTQEAEVG